MLVYYGDYYGDAAADPSVYVGFGRNGMFKLSGVRFWSPDPGPVFPDQERRVYIDGVTSRGQIANAGFIVPAASLVALCREFVAWYDENVQSGSEPEA